MSCYREFVEYAGRVRQLPLRFSFAAGKVREIAKTPRPCPMILRSIFKLSEPGQSFSYSTCEKRSGLSVPIHRDTSADEWEGTFELVSLFGAD